MTHSQTMALVDHDYLAYESWWVHDYCLLFSAISN